MDFTNGGNGSSDETSSKERMGKEQVIIGYTEEQVQQLEAFFKNCMYPTKKERKELVKELKLSAEQIHTWFQNKRDEMKRERYENDALRAENQKLYLQNLAIKNRLTMAPVCGTCCEGEEAAAQTRRRMQALLAENALLKQQLAGLLKLMASIPNKPDM